MSRNISRFPGCHRSAIVHCMDTDSVRLYRLGSNYKNRIEVIGRTGLIEAGDPLLI